MPVLKFEEPTKSIPVSALRPIPTVYCKVNCGCGESFSTIDDGYIHAVDTGHTLHITGEIRSQK